MGLNDLIRKYSTAGPRYTSYPTAPQFSEKHGEADYRQRLEVIAESEDPVTLYVHIPFCEKLCYYCGCNILLTKDHGRGMPYVESLLKEMREVAAIFNKKSGKRKKISMLSWGGGTPTFLSIDEITRLQKGTEECFEILSGAELSIEIDPRVTSEEQLQVLRKLGFNRVSLGVQDFNLEVQKVVNRIQSAEMTEKMLRTSHALGFQGVNFDLIYGLPNQSIESLETTVDEVIRIRPDRIAFYNYAHLPSLRPHQKILEQYPMPSADDRVEIFSRAYEKLTHSGYSSIGMDHFALETDELYLALKDGRLYRNFQGYSIQKGAGMIGIGASAIGEIGGGYFQNIREAKPYQESVDKTGLATMRGCLFSQDDIERKWVIQSLMCRFRLSQEEFEKQFKTSYQDKFKEELPLLAEFFSEGILVGTATSMRVTDLGRLFVRNVAMVFDAYLKIPSSATYSKTV